MAELVMMFDTVTGELRVKTIGSTHIADGSVVSGKLGDGAVISGAIASGQIGTFHIEAGAIVSSLVGANALANPHLANQGILSSAIGAGILANAHLANQGILSSAIGANIIGTPHIQNQGLLSSVYGAGSIGGSHVANYGLISGKVASGAITEHALASGISIDIAETMQEPSYCMAVSGLPAFNAVVFTASGYFGEARAAQSGRAPAVGILAAAVLSGAIGTFQSIGRVTNPAWNFSGGEGSMVYLGTSSEVTRTPPSASGYMVQRLGQVVAAETVLLFPDAYTIQIGQ